MKKYTSAALLAIKLTWKTVLTVFLTVAGLHIFTVFRELMPGGVPLQTTFAFESLLRSAAAPIGKWWCVMLLTFLTFHLGESRGSRTVYTMNRLGISELQAALISGAVFTGYFLLYWFFQLAICYGIFVWYSRFSLVSSNAWMLACWRSEWLHTLLPLGEWWGYLRNLDICASFGYSAAFGLIRSRRRKWPLASLVPPVFCLFLLSGRIGNFAVDMLLTVALASFAATDYFAVKGGMEDEDL